MIWVWNVQKFQRSGHLKLFSLASGGNERFGFPCKGFEIVDVSMLDKARPLQWHNVPENVVECPLIIVWDTNYQEYAANKHKTEITEGIQMVKFILHYLSPWAFINLMNACSSSQSICRDCIFVTLWMKKTLKDN